MTERLEHWAAHAPDRTFLSQRTAGGEWRELVVTSDPFPGATLFSDLAITSASPALDFAQAGVGLDSELERFLV